MFIFSLYSFFDKMSVEMFYPFLNCYLIEFWELFTYLFTFFIRCGMFLNFFLICNLYLANPEFFQLSSSPIGLSLNLPLFSFSLCMFTELLGLFRHNVGCKLKRSVVLWKGNFGSWKESPYIQWSVSHRLIFWVP